MKKTFLFLLIIYSLSAKTQTVSGLYSGTMYNDTTKMLQNYQLALSEYRGKITGYSYTTFVVNDTFYYGIRSIKASIKNDMLIVEDDKMLVNNFPESPSKGVKRSTVIPLNGQKDTLGSLSGHWETNRTKNYFSVSGSLDLKRDADSSQSALIGHLKDLNIISTPKYQPAVASSRPKETVAAKPKETKTTGKPVVAKTKPVPVVATVVPYEQRKNKVLQTLLVSSNDSLVLSFYDNGIVDGDVISVYINGQAIVSKARLTESAIKKTIRLTNVTDSVELKLVAETLGSLPPNTGLVVIQDGSNKYNLNFSADLQTNASIIFRKRK